jgi:hypothetical protein
VSSSWNSEWTAEQYRQFALLQEAWEALTGSLAAQERAEIATWPGRLRQLAAIVAKSKTAGRWTRGPTDLLGVLRLERDEVRNCRVLAWLLDPAGAHGLGVSFLKALLSDLYARAPCTLPADAVLEDAWVIDEEWRNGTRADVVVRAPRLGGGTLAIVIEAKISAAEGHRQGARLEELWGDPETETLFCFLTRNGRPMATGSPVWVTLRWTDLAHHLATCLQKSRHGRGRPAAEEYQRSLERHLR